MRFLLLPISLGFLFSVSNLSAQNRLITLNTSFGLVKYDNQENVINTYGFSLGGELPLGKRFSLGAEFDWHFYEPESAIAFPYPGTPHPSSLVQYDINRHQINLRAMFRYYFEEAFKGLYVGVFPSYSYLTITTSGYPQENQYSPSVFTDPSDQAALGAGGTYGYRFKLNNRFRINAFGSHQLFWHQTPDYKQQLHQFGIGLSYRF